MSFPLLLALAGLGIAFGPRRRLLPALAWLVGWAQSILPFFVAARYREPLLPLLAVVGGAGLVALRSRLREVPALSLGLALLLLPHALTRLVPVDLGVPGVKDRLDQGRAWFRTGDAARAGAAFDEALRLQPGLPEALYERALVDLAGEQWAQGRRASSRCSRPDPITPRPPPTSHGSWPRAAGARSTAPAPRASS